MANHRQKPPAYRQRGRGGETKKALWYAKPTSLGGRRKAKPIQNGSVAQPTVARGGGGVPKDENA